MVITRDGESPESVHMEITINKATPILRLSNKNTVYSGEEILIDSATVILENNETFSGDIHYDYYSDPDCISIMNENPRNAGTYYAKAYIEAPSDNYTSTYSEAAKINVEKANQTISGTAYYQSTQGTSIQMDAKSVSAADMMYSSDDENIVSIDDSGLMTLNDSGTTLVHAYALETQNYKEAIFDATVEVSSSDYNGDTQQGFSNRDDDSSENGYIYDNQGSDDDQLTLPEQAEQVWNQILATGDDSRYIVYTALVLGTLSLILFALIIVKEHKKQ